MGVITYTDEYTSSIPPSRLFKAVVIDAPNLIPKIFPQVVKSIEIIQGDGGIGSIRQINFAEGSQLNSVKNRIDELNEENHSYKYTCIEGDALADKLESIAYEVQFEPTPEGGSKNKMTSKYYTKADVVLSEEEIKAGKDNALEIYKIVEAYLLQNPDVYA
ncbi:major allergen Pru ar 1-like [Quercus lobata]|uniref:Bet v I/Major latex protein domain-containing protein n=1 Tax=Quercus lobata TaxID=97700 RepID=A0A7N2R689_QUELO|nr:major allergen Pru ar 1-like [Quercus lobata]